MFTSTGDGGQPGTTQEQAGQRPNADRVFGDVFEDVRHLRHIPPFLPPAYEDRSPSSLSLQLLRPEVERHLPVWSWLGSACGAGLGFITANVPGLVVGAYAGNRLGAIRDAKGKSVAAVFAELGHRQKVEVRRKRPWIVLHGSILTTTCSQILQALALKVLGTLYT